ncbi:HNH endonuclease signature motif containing protein [Marinobacterium litorale]|uniref:HNH endonuclease signature motif containing protein n=1 Tax=Marinobacterium litorale TaxID=404770 RepID=UPI000686F5A6|nr:HNH endonuclease [Marinobacterium litorale]
MIGDSNPIPISLLKTLVRLEVETGKLYWLPRSAELFSGGVHSKEQEAKRWNGRHAGTEAMTGKTSRGYRHGPLLGRWYRAHQVVFALHSGRWPYGHIDHINHDRSDNRPSNLREVEALENARNASTRSDNTSGQPGVGFDKSKGKWVARICDKGERIYLGAFGSIGEAVAARKAAERRIGYHENHGRSMS